MQVQSNPAISVTTTTGSNATTSAFVNNSFLPPDSIIQVPGISFQYNGERVIYYLVVCPHGVALDQYVTIPASGELIMSGNQQIIFFELPRNSLLFPSNTIASILCDVLLFCTPAVAPPVEQQQRPVLLHIVRAVTVENPQYVPAGSAAANAYFFGSAFSNLHQ